MTGLATVERVTALVPIAGADKIMLATVQGWETIVKADEFEVGDLCVFHQPDTVLPPLPRYEFLARANYRLKCMRMRGVVSEGLALPLSTVLQDLLGADVTALVPSVVVELGDAHPPFRTAVVAELLSVARSPHNVEFVQCVVREHCKESGTTKTHSHAALEEAFRSYSCPDFCVMFNNGMWVRPVDFVFKAGLDVSALVGIQKYQKPEPLDHRFRGHHSRGQHPHGRTTTFPHDVVPRTDEPNVQSAQRVLERILSDPKKMYVALKLDGTSFTVTPQLICSRNQVLEPTEDKQERTFFSNKTPRSPYHEIAERYTLPAKLAEYCSIAGRQLAVQGEICGPDIQLNRLGLSIVEFFVFSIYDIEKQEYVALDDMLDVCHTLGLVPVPRLVPPPNLQTSKQWLEYADTLTYPTSGKLAEGLVLRTTDATPGDPLRRLSCKVLSRAYKLKHGE
jgi:RNA ligase (TIGR02306 family)